MDFAWHIDKGYPGIPWRQILQQQFMGLAHNLRFTTSGGVPTVRGGSVIYDPQAASLALAREELVLENAGKKAFKNPKDSERVD